jgi:hypothetical protein
VSATDNRAAWEAVLDRLENDAAKVEQVLFSGEMPELATWELPRTHGPIPEDLLPRAREIQRRQAAAMEVLYEALRATRRHQALTDRVNRTTATRPSPAYVDITA